MNSVVKKVKKLCGEITVPGDKSISHRALMLAALAEGSTEIKNLSSCADVKSTIRCLQSLGVSITEKRRRTWVEGRGLTGLQQPQGILDAGNSGTTLRLLAGILAGQNFASVITGDDSLKKRPMKRIIEPLNQMGAEVRGTDKGCAPLTIHGGRLKALEHRLPIPSAQVKSCILLAGLYASGTTRVVEPAKSRDHTERLLSYLGAEVTNNESLVSVKGFPHLKSAKIVVPGDISSAAFFIVAASLIGQSELTIKNVGINYTRMGLIDVLRKMGGFLMLENIEVLNNEPRANLVVRSADLKGINISGPIVPRIIDEIPILAVAATRAQGETVIRDAKELRYKETDRIKATVTNLRLMGIDVTELPDGMIIPGMQGLKGARINSYGDHRIAMAFAIAGLMAKGETIIENADCVDISFPGFFQRLEEVCHE